MRCSVEMEGVHQVGVAGDRICRCDIHILGPCRCAQHDHILRIIGTDGGNHRFVVWYQHIGPGHGQRLIVRLVDDVRIGTVFGGNCGKKGNLPGKLAF